MANEAYVDAINVIKDLKKDFFEAFDSEAGERVLDHLKNITHYHRPCLHKEEHLFIQAIAMAQVIDHIYTMLEAEPQVIYNLNLGG